MQSYIYKIYQKIMPNYIGKRTAPRNVLLFALSCSMGAFSYSLCSPLSLSIVAASWLSGENHLIAFCGAALGAAFAGNLFALFMLCIYLALCLVWTIVFKNVKSRDKFLMVIASALLAIPLFRFDSVEATLFGLLNVILCAACTPIIQNGFRAVNTIYKRRFLNESEQASLALLAAAACMSLAPITPFGFSLSVFFATVISLLAARFLGVYGVAFSVACLAPLVLLFEYDYFIVVGFAIATLFASLFSRGGKWGVVSAFVGVNIILCNINAPAMRVMELCAGACLFAFMPRRFEKRAVSYLNIKTKGLKAKRCLDDISNRLAYAADTMDSFARTSGDAHCDFGLMRDVLTNIRADYTDENEREKYSMTVATAAAPKFEEEQTGDSLAIKDMGRTALIALSDGMGTGAPASSESLLALEYFCELLEAGFDMSRALVTASDMLTKDGGETYATMDALRFDKRDASASFLKCGSPPSFIIRDQSCIAIEGDALPIGIVQGAEPALHNVNLKRDDILIMMTDGVFDALGEMPKDAVMEQYSLHPYLQDLVQAIMAAAKEGSKIADDMSIVAVRVESAQS